MLLYIVNSSVIFICYISAPYHESQRPLPHGWVQFYDVITQQYYYLNRITQQTQWERPSKVYSNGKICFDELFI